MTMGEEPQIMLTVPKEARKYFIKILKNAELARFDIFCH